MKIMTEVELLSFRQAAQLTGVSERTLSRMVARQELTVYWFGGTKRLSREELRRPKAKKSQGELTAADTTEGV